MIPRLLCLVVFVSVCYSVAQAQTSPHPVTVDDNFQVKEVAEPQISADGQWIAYAVTTATLKDDKNETRIWMVPAAGGDAIPMTVEGNSSSHPRWSPDGKYLAFLSERNEGKTQVWLLDRRGGEAQQITTTIQDVNDFAWSPDSKRLVLILQDPSADEKEEAEAKKKCDADDKDCKAKHRKTSRHGFLRLDT